MLVLTCPYCGIAAAETELSPGGTAHIPRAGPKSSDAEFEAYLFTRSNPRGPHLERWCHRHGCGRWFIAARCTLTQRVFGTYPAQRTEPPADVLRAMTEAAQALAAGGATQGSVRLQRGERTGASPDLAEQETVGATAISTQPLRKVAEVGTRAVPEPETQIRKAPPEALPDLARSRVGPAPTGASAPRGQQSLGLTDTLPEPEPARKASAGPKAPLSDPQAREKRSLPHTAAEPARPKPDAPPRGPEA